MSAYKDAELALSSLNNQSRLFAPWPFSGEKQSSWLARGMRRDADRFGRNLPHAAKLNLSL